MAENPLKDSYVVSGFKLTADIEGVGEEIADIVSISGTYALNTIPTAALTLACGINAATGNEAFAHVIQGNMPLRAKVTVRVEIITDDGKEEKSPSEKFIVFQGYAAGFGFQRAQDNAQYVLHLVHWLDDLNVGSMLSRNFFPGSPFNLASGANEMDGAGGANGNTLVNAWPMFDPAAELINLESIQRDFWGQSLQPILLALAKARDPSTGCGAFFDGERETLIADALKKIPGGFTAQPLKLDFNGLDAFGEDLAYAVEQFLAATAFAGFNYATFWSTLTGQWGPNFLFAVSPGATFANIIPYFGALRFKDGDPNFKTIDVDDYSYANFMANTSTILEGVDIFWSAPSVTGFIKGYNTPKEPPELCSPLGSYPKRADRTHRGSVLLKEPPGWLSNCVDLASSAGSAESIGEGGERGRDTIVPDKGPETRAGGKKMTRDEAMLALKSANILDRFAEQWYKTELLQQRYGELSGKLRFDIAPGSTVKIKTASRNMPMLSDANADMVAFVTKVSFVINSESAQAGTSFALTNVRTAVEDRNPLMTADKPPLYQNGWAGGPLIRSDPFIGDINPGAAAGLA